jgi:hypothetical protein
MNNQDLGGTIALEGQLTASKLDGKEKDVWLADYGDGPEVSFDPSEAGPHGRFKNLRDRELWPKMDRRILEKADVGLIGDADDAGLEGVEAEQLVADAAPVRPLVEGLSVEALEDVPVAGERRALRPGPEGPGDLAALGGAGGGVLTGELYAVHIKADGSRVDYGLVGRHLVVTVGKNYLALTFDNTAEPESMKFHGVGTGTTAAAAGDQTLQTESTTALNPDTTRATGSQAHSTNTYTTVGTPTFDASAAITEWGLFNNATAAGAFNATTQCLFDRQVFSAINVASGDSIQFTYVLTIS